MWRHIYVSETGGLTSHATLFQLYIYVTAHRCAGGLKKKLMCRRTEEELGPTVGLPRHRLFVGFCKVSVEAPERDHHFYVYSEKQRKRKWSDSVLWKNPYTHREIQTATWQHKNATKNFDFTTIADRLRTVSWGVGLNCDPIEFRPVGS